jgi:hypothetical protein
MIEEVGNNAWRALEAHLAQEVIEGRESIESAGWLLSGCRLDDLEARMRKVGRSVAKTLAAQIVDRVIYTTEQTKAPFWAKKWRGQR